MTQLSDEILIAYADGELGDAQVRAVNGVLDNDAETFARLRALQPSQQRLADAFQSMLQTEGRERAARRADEEARSRPSANGSVAKTRGDTGRGRSLALAAMTGGVVLAVLGGTFGYFVGRSPLGGSTEVAGSFWDESEVRREMEQTDALVNRIPRVDTTAAIDTGTAADGQGAPPSWYRSVAKQHQREVDVWLSRFDRQNRNPEIAMFQLSKSGVAPETVPVLNGEELLFIGAETAAIDGQPYARLAYRDLSQGAIPVGLYVGGAGAGTLTLERGSEEALNYVRWEQGARRYMLIAAIPYWRLIVIAAAVQKQVGP